MTPTKVILYTVKYNGDYDYPLPLGMTLKDAKGFAKEYFEGYKDIRLVSTLYEKKLETVIEFL